jgi:hypothetical protein
VVCAHKGARGTIALHLACVKRQNEAADGCLEKEMRVNLAEYYNQDVTLECFFIHEGSGGIDVAADADAENRQVGCIFLMMKFITVQWSKIWMYD